MPLLNIKKCPNKLCSNKTLCYSELRRTGGCMVDGIQIECTQCGIKGPIAETIDIAVENWNDCFLRGEKNE